ncbi:MAG: hypothetical protein JWP97_259 [Labilithrix sp.]|nr:hypothetical protein [Labilithrix sp.]
MKTRLLALTLLGLATTEAAAQAVPPPGAQPPVVQTPAAPPTAVEAPAAVVPLAPPAPAELRPPAASPPPLQRAPQAVDPRNPNVIFQSNRPVLVQPGPAPRRRYGSAPVQQPAPDWRPTPREPRRYGNAGAPFALGVGGSLLWRNDHAEHVLSKHKATGALDVFATYDVWSPMRGAVIAVGASLRHEAWLGNDDYSLHNNAVQAELMARYGVTRWLWPHVRAAVGGVTSHFKQRDTLARLDYDDRSSSAIGTFGAGFTLRTPARLFETHRGWLASLSFGLLVEGGYTVAKPADFHLKPTQSGDLARSTFAVGSVDRSAPYLRLMGVLRF